MAQTLNVVLTDPDEAGEQDLEIRDTESFLLVRAPQDLRDLEDREGSTEKVAVG